MDYLVQCGCGHSIERHGENGCAGERNAACSCRLNRATALQSTIASVRSTYVAVHADAAAAGWTNESS